MLEDWIRADTRRRLSLERKQLKLLEQLQSITRGLGQTGSRLKSSRGDGKVLQ